MLIAVTYHYVRPVFGHPFPGIHGVTPDEVESQLRLLGSVGEFVSPKQIRDAVRGQSSLPERAIAVTFDDGLREQFEWALPVLDRLGVAALFFVNTGPISRCAVSTVHKIHLLSAQVSPGRLWAMLEAEAKRLRVRIRRDGRGRAASVQYPYDTPESAELKYLLNTELAERERNALVAPCFTAVFGEDEAAVSRSLYMSVEQLRELGARSVVGTHCDEHVLLSGVSPDSVRDRVLTSVEQLSKWSGQAPYALSYPYGSYEASSRAAGAGAAAAGIEFAFTGERAGNPDLAHPLHLARFDCNDLPGGRHARFDPETLFDAVLAARWYR
jgi:peptidoglycan/xylan/chitin deacetylase (PgdA/CDA1 family)